LAVSRRRSQGDADRFAAPLPRALESSPIATYSTPTSQSQMRIRAPKTDTRQTVSRKTGPVPCPDSQTAGRTERRTSQGEETYAGAASPRTAARDANFLQEPDGAACMG